MPLVWASKLIGKPLKERVTGSDMIAPLGKLVQQKSYRLFLLGASEKSSKAAAEWFERSYPGLKIAGRYSPPVAPLHAMDNETILRKIAAADPDIILVAFGNPKQEKWIAMHQHEITRGVVIGVGASLDFLAGHMSRAPRWIQVIGAEWIYRLAQEPRRLARRYAENILTALIYLPHLILILRTQKNRSKETHLTHAIEQNQIEIKPVGQFTGTLVDGFDALASQAYQEKKGMLLDLSATDACGIDALGSMIHANAQLNRCGTRLKVVGASKQMRRVVHASCAFEPVKQTA
jgi:N-acetylglucosaminyldiphosphoundecaprenol N-acetyl-beta-D-mannosaminyltransferase